MEHSLSGSEDDIEAAIHKHVGTQPLLHSPVQDDSIERAQQASQIEQAASEAASSASSTASSSKVASEAREQLRSLEGSSSVSSSSVSTSRASTPQVKTKHSEIRADERSPLVPTSLQYA